MNTSRYVRYVKCRKGPDAGSEISDDYYAIREEMMDISHVIKAPMIEEDSSIEGRLKAEALYILPDYHPISVANLRVSIDEKEMTGILTLIVKHFSEKGHFPEIQELADRYGLDLVKITPYSEKKESNKIIDLFRF